MADGWAQNTAVWDSDKVQSNPSTPEDVEMSVGRDTIHVGVAGGCLFEPDEEMGMVVDGVLVMPNNPQEKAPAAGASTRSWGSYLNEQQAEFRHEEPDGQWSQQHPFHQPYLQTSHQSNVQPEIDWAVRLRGPTVSFEQQSLWTLHPNSLRLEDQRPHFFHLRNSRLLAQPGRHRHVVPPDPAAISRRNMRQREMEEQERRKYVAPEKRARKTVNPRPPPRPRAVLVSAEDTEMVGTEEAADRPRPSKLRKRFAEDSPQVIDVVALGSRGGRTEKRAADLHKVEKSVDVGKKAVKKRTPTPASVPDDEDEAFEEEMTTVVGPPSSSALSEGSLDGVTRSLDKLRVRKYSYPSTQSGRLDATAWKSVNGEFGAIMQRCFCSVPSEDITKRETISQLELCEQELIKEKKIGTTCCAPYRNSPAGTKICDRNLEEGEQNQVRYLPQTAVLGFFCAKHSALLSQHKVCPYCNEFYENGNKTFLVCRAIEGEEHLFHLKCRSRMTMLQQCPHCLHDKRNTVEEWYTGPKKSSLRPMTKSSVQKDKHLFSDADFVTVELPDFQTSGGTFRFTGYIPKDQLDTLRSKDASSISERTELVASLLTIARNQPANRDALGQVVTQSPALLHNCAKCGDVLSVVLLHKMGCDINVAEASGLTPLMVAAINQQYAVVQALIVLGADLNLQDEEGRTALHWAAKKKEARLMRYLLKNKADLRMLDKKGFVATFWTMSWISYKELLSLVLDGIDLRCLDYDHWSLLHWAAFLFRNELLVFFLDLGMASLPDIWGDTPVHVAVRVGNFQFVQMLLMRNPPLVIWAENHKGQSPLQLAQHLLDNEPKAEEVAALQKTVELMRYFAISDPTEADASDKSTEGPVRGDVSGDITGGKSYLPIPCFNFVNRERYGKDPFIYSNVVVRSLFYQHQPKPLKSSEVKKPCKLSLEGQGGHCTVPQLCAAKSCGVRHVGKKGRVSVQAEMVNGFLVPSAELATFRVTGQPVAVPCDGKRPPTTVELARLVQRLSEQAAVRPDLRKDLCHIMAMLTSEFRKDSRSMDDLLPAIKLPAVVERKNGGQRLRSSSVGDFRRSGKKWWVSWKRKSRREDSGDKSYDSLPCYKMDLFRELEKANCEVFLKDAMVRFERAHPLERWDMSYYSPKAPGRHPPWRADARLDGEEAWSVAPRLCPASAKCFECEGGRQALKVKASSYATVERDGGEASYYDLSVSRILEGCSVYCHCDESCPQRATQWPTTARLALFYVDTTVQWGVMALTKITPGQFLAEYTGELVCGNLYSNDTYMYELQNLQTTDVHSTWVVDAKSVGNIARFFNHCCKPSAKTIEVFEHGVVVPRLCVFAVAEVHPGQQITLDYGDNWWKAKWDNEKIKCNCQHQLCKYRTAEDLNSIQNAAEEAPNDYQEPENESEEGDDSDPDYDVR
ncbi:hypothetical protein RvY_13917 [Ramazzottius varieornatus]|uniref:SET domain-containing protein n=1 Tax=Ramazzottius varieornatus TaxID=947166 RepID=A0A1D1VUP9_RAMVA|nr:hypothetical protein RvY_13917 [Ramazzottius varieornatus]